ncbi:hypothetical protein Taro_053774 [Colocasia esculenta]|uniref:aldehyde oxygenase (deformylating) n=1 Tax=Colocasia esculenta TaxID=4460 RepID=A0A843XN46_COLES|nr:hypothetical protein [Colocasia esculenta]
MATKPGLLTHWPWQKLGGFKYLVLAPWVVYSVHSYLTKEAGERDLSNLLIFPFLLSRWIHNQIWISLSRFQTARSKHRIVNKSLEFEQVDRESNWDDQIILNGTFLFLSSMFMPGASHLPFWNTKGVIITILLHTGPVEFLYYWLHRALHHHYLYNRYHSHHHQSIVTEPITAVIHPFGEHLAYFALFTIPLATMVWTGTLSIVALAGYEFYIDFMNNLGHCNFELVPKWFFSVLPPLKYLMYTPSFHSLHHTQFRTNYALFMPMYDYLYGTADKSSDELYEAMQRGKEENPDVVHLTHPTTLHSVYHLRVGFASIAASPYAAGSRWYVWAMWPLTLASALLFWFCGSAFTVERNRMKKLAMQTWAIPRYSFQYKLRRQKADINELIEKAILQAEEMGAKVVSLGLLNQGEELNKRGQLYIEKHPEMKLKIVDGSSLGAAVVVHSIPKETKQVLLRGTITKTAQAVALALCQKGVQVLATHRDEFEALKLSLPTNVGSHLLLSDSHFAEVWLVGEGLTPEEQLKAPKGARFIPFSQFPPKRLRKDCVYYSTPAMAIPKSLENMHACENWLPRRVMSAWRVAGIVHALEGWGSHECGDAVFDPDQVWRASLDHGFLPLARP